MKHSLVWKQERPPMQVPTMFIFTPEWTIAFNWCCALRKICTILFYKQIHLRKKCECILCICVSHVNAYIPMCFDLHASIDMLAPGHPPNLCMKRCVLAPFFVSKQKQPHPQETCIPQTYDKPWSLHAEVYQAASPGNKLIYIDAYTRRPTTNHEHDNSQHRQNAQWNPGGQVSACRWKRLDVERATGTHGVARSHHWLVRIGCWWFFLLAVD